MLLLALLALTATPAAAKDDPKASKKPQKPAATRAEAILRAVRRLDEDVSTGDRDMNEQHRVFTTAIAGLDFLLDASGAKGVAHADRVDRCAETVGRYVEGAARAFASDRGAKDEMSSMMWSQTTWALSAATLFYAERAARGQAKADSTARLREIADLLVKHQQADGGFGHDQWGRPRLPEISIPLPGGGTRKLKYPATLLATTNWAAFAVGVLRPVGGKRLDPVVAKVKEYFRTSQCPGGAFPYDPSQRAEGGFSGDVTAPARTAGSYVGLRALGAPGTDKVVSRAADYLKRQVDDLPEGHGSAPHGVFFGALACLWMGAEPWSEFQKTVVPRILAGQDPDTGALDCVCRKGPGTICESFLHPNEMFEGMPDMGPGVDTWRRAYVNALNLFALLLDKGKLKLLDVPADAPAPTTTPSTPGDDPPAMGG